MFRVSPLLTLILMLLLLPVLLAVSGFCSGSETALFSLTQRERRQITLSKTLLDRKLGELLGEIRGLLITLLLANMVTNVLYFVISTVALLELQRYLEISTAWVPVTSGGSLMGLIIFGEVLPKMFAARAPLVVSRFVAIPLWLLHRLITPLRHVINELVITPLARLLAPRERTPELSTQELEMMLELSQHHGVIDATEEQLLQQVLSLSQLRVRDIMTPRVDIKAYDIVDPPILLIELIRATRLECIVVYEDDLDHIVGLAYARQVLLKRPKNQKEASTLVRQATFVPESQRADKLLVHFRKMGTTMAIAVDEYGGTAGIVTLEDVVEQMIGHISGPYEGQQDQPVQQLGPGQWRVSADLPVHEWAHAIGTLHQIPGVSTIGGLVMAKLGKLPKAGDVALMGNLQFKVESMNGRRIESLLLQLVIPELTPHAADSKLMTATAPDQSAESSNSNTGGQS